MDSPRRKEAKPTNPMASPAELAVGSGPAAALPDAERVAKLIGPLGSPTRLRLLRFLTRPHYLEEIASHMKVSHQAARKHVDKLVAIGVLEKRAGVRDTGRVTEYVINPGALFLIYEEVEKLGSLRREARDDPMMRTAPGTGRRPATEASAGPCLWIVHGLNTGFRLDLGDPPSKGWVLGRDARCDLALAHDSYASNRHAEVTHDGTRYFLTDLRSTNGTRLNWVTIPTGERTELGHGDIIGVGRTLLVFWAAESPARNRAAPARPR